MLVGGPWAACAVDLLQELHLESFVKAQALQKVL